MSASRPPPEAGSTLACCNTLCGLAFGGPVRFCPFCGAAQVDMPRAGVPEERQHDPWATPTEPARGSPEPGADGTAAPPDTTPGLQVVDAIPARPAGRRRWRALAAAALLAAAAGWLLRERLVQPTGQLVVSALPLLDATVTLDGADAGRPGQSLTATAGDHLVGLRAAHWSAEPVHIVVAARRLARATLSPKPDPATLKVQAQPPGAAVSVAGRRVAALPATLSLAPGTWRLSAEAPGFQPATQSVVLAPGEQRTVALQLDPVPDTRTRIVAQVGAWSAPLLLTTGDSFSFVFRGRVRARLGGRVLLLDGAGADLGTLDVHSLQLKSATEHPLPVEVVIHHTGVP